MRRAGQPKTTTLPTPRRVITDAMITELATEADVDERTVLRRLAGLPVRGRPGRRVDAALVKAHLAAEPVPVYIDPAAGDDSHSGLSREEPLQTFAAYQKRYGDGGHVPVTISASSSSSSNGGSATKNSSR